MDLEKVDSYLEGVEERHDEAGCKLVEVREGAAQTVQILGEVQGALEEAWCMIECIREGDLYEEEELDLMRSRLLETSLRHEELGSEYDSLNTILGI